MTAPTLLIGWAGADWKVIRPLLDAGKMPNLAGLIARGVWGNLATLQPQSQGLLWTGMATGHHADRHGIHGVLRVDADRGVLPVSSLDRRVPSIWNVLSERGLSSNVVGWPCSHPAEPIRGVMASELFGWVSGAPDSPGPPPPGSIHPGSWAAELAEIRIHPAQLGLDELVWFVPQAHDIDQRQDRMLAEVAISVARCATHHAAVTLLLEDHPADLTMVCYDPLELLGPHFMALYPPRLPYVPVDLFERYRHVIPHMYQYLDLLLGRLLELAGPAASVAIVSERGYHSDHLRPQTAELAVQRLAAPWIRDQGILVLAGPNVLEGEHIEGASLLDILPTVLTMMRLPVPGGLAGRPLWHAFRSRLRPEQLRAWSGGSEPGNARHDAARRLAPEEVESLLRHHAALREIEPEEVRDRERARDPAHMRSVDQGERLNLALSYLSTRRAAKALPLLRALHEERPDDERISIHLARCLQATGATAEAATLMQRVAEAGPSRPREHLMLSRIHQNRGEPAKALASLFRAEQAHPGQPGLHCRIGEVYLQMRRWEDAERAFGKALGLNADSALAHHGMALVHLALERPEQAVDSALTTTGLNPQSAQAHYHLGLALARFGRPGEAIQAFEASLALNNRNISAHQWLARLYREAAGDTVKSERHESEAVHLQVARMLRQQMEDHRD
jgi:tetratricopeptide (TPR) repeat protein